jgi:PBSX family phage terminase large subunit
VFAVTLVPISAKQQRILTFPYITGYRALICDGAVRSGKTSIMTLAFVDWAMREFNNTNFAICGKTVGSAIKNIIMPYLALSYARKKYKLNFTRSDNKMVVKRGGVINTFYVYGGKDESSYMLIQGITLGGVLLDEVALMTQSFVEEALARCLTFPNRRYWFNCNPDSPAHWFYNEWILQPEKHKALHLHFTMHDNPVLTDDAREQAENDFSGVFYERKVLGKWIQAEGIVYPMFNKDFHIVPGAPRPYDRYVISIDYGTMNATAMLFWGHSNGVWYCIHEYYHSGRDTGYQKTDDEYYTELEKLAGNLPIASVIIDPSSASFITLVRRKGRFRVKPAENVVIDGIRECGTALQQGLIKINECCTNIIREFGLYSWDEKSPEDKPLKINDHTMDSMRYFVKTIGFANPKPKSITTSSLRI